MCTCYQAWNAIIPPPPCPIHSIKPDNTTIIIININSKAL